VTGNVFWRFASLALVVELAALFPFAVDVDFGVLVVCVAEEFTA